MKEVDSTNDSIQILGNENEIDAKDEQVSTLQERLKEVENRLDQERFIWVITTVILIDALIFINLENWSGPFVIGIFELIGLYVLADRLKIDTVAPLIDRLAGFAHRVAKTEKNTE